MMQKDLQIILYRIVLHKTKLELEEIMSELISGKEAKLAWANGVELEFYSQDLNKWFGLNDEPFMSDVFETRKIRLKPKTILLNGIEVPCCGENYQYGDAMYILNSLEPEEYSLVVLDKADEVPAYWWKSEEEIKQVVAALRSIFNVK